MQVTLHESNMSLEEENTSLREQLKSQTIKLRSTQRKLQRIVAKAKEGGVVRVRVKEDRGRYAKQKYCEFPVEYFEKGEN